MKNKLGRMLRWAIVFILSFLIVYSVVLVGGWKLFESNNPILIEIGVSLIISIFVFIIIEIVYMFEKRIAAMERKVKELEDEIANR